MTAQPSDAERELLVTFLRFLRGEASPADLERFCAASFDVALVRSAVTRILEAEEVRRRLDDAEREHAEAEAAFKALDPVVSAIVQSPRPPD